MIAIATASTLVVLGCCIGIIALSRAPSSKVDSAARPPDRPSPQPARPPDRPSPQPASEPPADQIFSGKGDKVIKLNPLDEDYFHFAVITHKGSGNFVIIALDANGNHLDLIVNEIGSYSGTRPITARGYPAALEVKAGGTWSITVQVAQKAPVWTGSAAGEGDAVYLVGPGTLSGLTTVKISHNGKGNFVVTAHGSGPDLLVNEIGAYSGEVAMPSRTVIVEIVADGSWTLTKSS